MNNDSVNEYDLKEKNSFSFANKEIKEEFSKEEIFIKKEPPLLSVRQTVATAYIVMCRVPENRLQVSGYFYGLGSSSC